MNIWETDKVVLFIAFIIPGFISLKTYELMNPSDLKESTKQIVDAITYSCINYSLLSWAIYLVESNKFQSNFPVFYIVFYFFVLFVFPVIWALLWIMLRKSQFFQKNAPHPVLKPWDYIFSQRKWYWVVATLNDGSKIAGKYGDDSFASSAPAKEQIYLQEAWVLNDEGGFERPRNQTEGILIVTENISSLEFFKFNPEEDQNGRQENSG